MKYIWFLCFIIFSAQIQAAPFLVCDPTNDPVDTLAWQEGTGVVNRSALLMGACHGDLSSIYGVAGAHTLTVWFESSLNGAKSVTTPFTFTPYLGGGKGPANMKVSPN